MTAITDAQLQAAPKVLLHDHLDGGLRPATLVELAREAGYRGLPTMDPDVLAAWVTERANRGDLGLYLETFTHTVGVLQTTEALRRVAVECVEDLAADGVVYAEVRFAPELHQEAGLTLEQVLDAVLAGVADGTARSGVRVGVLVAAMRTGSRSEEVAGLALRHRDHGIVGFDLAGAEAGYPPSAHRAAFDRIRRAHFHTTIHAGEAYGPPSIDEAIHACGAERLGHGVRIVDDIAVTADGTAHLGRLAAYLRDRRIALELCPTSNVHTGAVATVADHPVGLLADLGFRVTVNTDNRLMSDTSMTRELRNLVAAFDWGWPQLRRVTVDAAESAFLPHRERTALVEEVILPAFDALGVAQARD